MRTLADLSPAERALLAALRRRVAGELPGLGVRLTLFGSRARGNAEPDADMDILVEVDGEEIDPDVRQRLRHIANGISLETGIVVTLFVVDGRTRVARGDFSIFESIREEGIAV